MSNGRFGLLLFKRDSLDVQAMRAALAAVMALVGQAIEAPAPRPGDPPRGHWPTSVDDDGRIVVPEGRTPRELSSLIMQFFPQRDWGDAARVAWEESSWKNDAIRSTLHLANGACNVPLGVLPNGMTYYSEESVGYYQINRCSHGGSRSFWENSENNVRKAGGLYRDSGFRWTPWIATADKLGLLGDRE